MGRSPVFHRDYVPTRQYGLVWTTCCHRTRQNPLCCISRRTAGSSLRYRSAAATAPSVKRSGRSLETNTFRGLARVFPAKPRAFVAICWRMGARSKVQL